eukprot:scaffold1.g5739.t1
MTEQEAHPLVEWPYGATDPVASAKLLAVGAGGIGCELLKTLVMSGFRDIQVIDMDTIETSNLNRQFLFRKRHVGQSKAAVAAEAVRSMRPGVRVTPHQDNVIEGPFDLEFFKGFDLVVNGLDNVAARRHTECYECSGKQAPKSFPICTIRNTPDKPIHCVVWAKELLFERLFGRPDAANDLDDGAAPAGEDAGAAAGAAAAAGAGAAGGGGPAEPAPSFFLRRAGEGAGDYAARVFGCVFGSQIEAVRSVDDLWKARPPPQPLSLADILPRRAFAANGCSADGAAAADGSASPAGAMATACRALGLADPHAVWDVAQSARVFLEAVRLFHEARGEELGSATFDKDDALAVEFVTAAANLRAACYGIPRQSLFVTKASALALRQGEGCGCGMAGNIIHAIASTNAIVSGLIAIEALKLLSGNAAAAALTFVNQNVSMKKLIVPTAAPEPNPGCVVCGTAQAHLRLHTGTTTLAQLVDKASVGDGVLKGRLALKAPRLESGTFVYEEGEDLEQDEVAMYARLLPRPLAELPGGGVRHGAALAVGDQEQHFSLTLMVSHAEDLDEAQHPDGFELAGTLPEAQPEEAAPAAAAAAGEPDGAAVAAAPPARKVAVREDASGMLELLDSEDEGPAAGVGGGAARGAKRKAASGGKEVEAAGEGGVGGKRARTEGGAAAATEAVDVVELLSSDED